LFLKIRVPNAYPYILSALKVTASAAVIGAVVGEFVASQRGLGFVIITTQSSMNTPAAFAALVWISILGLLLFGLVAGLSRLLAPWQEETSVDRGVSGTRRTVMNMDRRCTVRALLGAALLALGSAASAQGAPEKFTFALNWFAVGDHAAYWVALDKGYYTQRGLEVTLENSKGSGDSIAKVDTGRADAGLADAVRCWLPPRAARR
jgi:hypothetical protein